ncbi:MAG: cation diffusion facilitator family transporter [Holosporales bacterium]|jgi:ferrous-iron efflux pump FieF|nr:cation diffusion facilitator family transporter [Holosporales bacterium]
MFCCSAHSDVGTEIQGRDRAIVKKLVLYVFAITLGIVGLRAWAYFATKSLAIEAAFLDSIKDCFVSLLNVDFIWLSTKSADAKYPFGYGKIEAFAALIQSIFLLVVGASIIYEDVAQHASHESIVGQTNCWVTVALVFSLFLVVLLAVIQTHYAKKIKSAALRADSAHYKADIAMNAAVILCFLASSKLHWLDSLVGIGIVVYFFVIAIMIGKRSLDCLLDRSLPIETNSKISEIVDNAGVTQFSVVTRHLGRGEFILVKVTHKQNASTANISAQQKRVESDIHKQFPRSYVVVSNIFEERRS